MESLPFCKNDAEEMYRLLASPEIGFEIPDSNKITGKVKDKEMRKAISRFFKDSSITSNDTLLLYFAGHGVTDNSGEVYMASSEIDSKEPFNGGFPFRQLTKWMNESYSTRIITTLDCCHSGAFELTTGSRGDPNEEAKKAHNDMEDKSNALKQGRGKCLLAASESTQRAFEIKEKNHGIFTYYLLEGLKGKPQSVDEYGNVTVDRLADYVYDTISSLPPEKKPNQMPIRKVEGGGRIFLANHPALAKTQPKQQEQQQHQQLQEGTAFQKDSILEFIGKALILLEEEQYDKAIKIFDTILILRPEHVEASNGKGMAFYKQKKYNEALECFRETLRIKPRNVVANDYVGMIKDRINKELSREAKPSSKDNKQDPAANEKRAEKDVIKALNESTQSLSYDNKGAIPGADPRNPYNDPTLPYYEPNLGKKGGYRDYTQKPAEQYRPQRVPGADPRNPYNDPTLPYYEPNLGKTSAEITFATSLDQETEKHVDDLKPSYYNPNWGMKNVDSSTYVQKPAEQYRPQRVPGADPRNPYNDPTLPYYEPNLGKKGGYRDYTQKPAEQYRPQRVPGADPRNPYNDPTLPYYMPDLGKKSTSSQQTKRPTQQVYTEAVATDDPRNEAAEQWFLQGTSAASRASWGYPEDYEKAIEYFDKALALNPNLGKVWKHKGYALSGLGRNHEAAESFKKAKALGYSQY